MIALIILTALLNVSITYKMIEEKSFKSNKYEAQIKKIFEVKVTAGGANSQAGGKGRR